MKNKIPLSRFEDPLALFGHLTNAAASHPASRKEQPGAVQTEDFYRQKWGGGSEGEGIGT